MRQERDGGAAGQAPHLRRRIPQEEREVRSDSLPVPRKLPHLRGESGAQLPGDMDELHRYGQKMAMERMGWTKEDFMREFGRNYLDEEDLQPTEEKPTGTFQILDEELCVNW